MTASAKWSASEVAALLAAWRDALKAPKRRGFSVSAFMVKRFVERCGGATTRGLAAMCFKRETLRNMAELIEQYHANVEKKKKTTRTKATRGASRSEESEASELAWFSLDVAQRKAWFAKHNARSYSFLDIDEATFEETEQLNDLARELETNKRKCYRRVLLRRDESDEWRTVREQSVGSWAATVATASAVVEEMDVAAALPSSLAATGLETDTSEGEQSDDDGGDSAVEATQLVSQATTAASDNSDIAGELASETPEESEEQSSKDSQQQQHQSGDDDSSTESDSDFGAWDQDEDGATDDDSGTPASQLRIEENGEEEEEKESEPAASVVAGASDDTEEEVPGRAEVAPAPPHNNQIRVSLVSARTEVDSHSVAERESPQLPELAASPVESAVSTNQQPVLVKNLDRAKNAMLVNLVRNLPVESTRLTKNAAPLNQTLALPAEKTRQSENAAPNNQAQSPVVEKFSSSTIPGVDRGAQAQSAFGALDAAGCSESDTRQLPEHLLLLLIKSLEMQTEHVKNMLSKAKEDKKADQNARKRDLGKMRRLDKSVQELVMQTKEIQIQQDRHRVENTLSATELQDLKTRGRDDKHFLMGKLAELATLSAKQDGERKREVDALKRECAKLREDADRRDQEMLQMRADLEKMRLLVHETARTEGIETTTATRDPPAADALGEKRSSNQSAALSITAEPERARPSDIAMVQDELSQIRVDLEHFRRMIVEAARKEASPMTPAIQVPAAVETPTADVSEEASRSDDQPATHIAKIQDVQAVETPGADALENKHTNDQRAKQSTAPEQDRARKRKRATVLEAALKTQPTSKRVRKLRIVLTERSTAPESKEAGETKRAGAVDPQGELTPDEPEKPPSLQPGTTLKAALKKKCIQQLSAQKQVHLLTARPKTRTKKPLSTEVPVPDVPVDGRLSKQADATAVEPVNEAAPAALPEPVYRTRGSRSRTKENIPSLGENF